VAAYARWCYVDRAGKITGQLRGHGRKVGSEWVVQVGAQSIRLQVEPNGGGCEIVHLGERHTLRTGWQIGQILFEAQFDEEPVCLQFERIGLRYRIIHDGVQLETTVLSPRAAELLALMPHKVPPDLSKFLLSPMPGLLVEIAVKPGLGSEGRRAAGDDRSDENGEHPARRARCRRAGAARQRRRERRGRSADLEVPVRLGGARTIAGPGRPTQMPDPGRPG